MAIYLRCLTSIELYMYAPYYTSHPLVEQQHQHSNGPFNSKANAFAMCISDAALDSFNKEDLTSSILAEAVNNAQNHQFSSFICMLALSSVMKLPIESYYPIGKSMDSLSRMFNCTIYPREWSTTPDLQTDRLHIFRCAVLLIDYVKTREIPRVKNHYVALCNVKPSSSVGSNVNELYITPELPKFGPDSFTQIAEKSNLSRNKFSSLQEKPLPDVFKNSTSETNVTRPIMPSARGKLKQTLLDKMVLKKRKLDDEFDQQESSICPSTVEERGAPTSIDLTATSHPGPTSRFPKPSSIFM